MNREDKKPQVSVIIPVHNGAKTVGQAIDSALLQGVAMEIIVIDDGSSDDIEQALAVYDKRPEVHFYKNRKNIGVAATRNRGVRMAAGTFVAFLDSDDWWMPDKLKKQLACLESTGSVLCATARELVHSDGSPTGRIIPVQTEITYRKLLYQNSINCSSVLLRREVALEFPMGHDDSHEDYIMWLEVLRKYHQACAINEPLLKYRMTEGSKSGNKLQSARMNFKVYRHMGYGYIKSLYYQMMYMYNGIKKYYF